MSDVKALLFAPLQSAEEIYLGLMRNPSDVKTDPQQAAKIWMIFRRNPIDPAQLQKLQYRAFLQAALMSAIEGSNAMGWIETIFRSSYKPDASIKGLMKALVSHAFKMYYKHWKAEPPELYQTVIDTIAYSHKPYFDMIEQGMDL
jgi:hypothetical protein